MRFHPYLRLMRFDKPTGWWLLFWPCAWSVELAVGGFPWRLLLLFALGAALMRAAGCIVNDMIDRELDRKVARTRSRPLASGEVSMREAFLLLLGLLAASAMIALGLGWKVVAISAFWLIPIALYPWMKRITWWPQAFLGLTFNAGALFGFLATQGGLPLEAWLLYAAGWCWTMGYDTIYALQDRADDEAAGIRSTALRFGTLYRRWVGGFYLMMLLLLISIGILTNLYGIYYFGLAGVAAHMLWQLQRVKYDHSLLDADYWPVFRSNITLGGVVFLSLFLGRF